VDPAYRKPRMIQPDVVTAGVRLVRAEEAWEPVLFGGMIPILGAGAVFALIRYAIKDPPEDEGPESDEPPPPGPDDSDHEGPLS
jgi:hypothetical protein